MTDTPIAELHRFGINFHKTAPLKRAGFTTVEQVVELVAEHRANPLGSRLSGVTGMGRARVEAVLAAVDRWSATATDAPDQYVLDGSLGGVVCSICETPTESEPCRDHQPIAWQAIN